MLLFVFKLINITSDAYLSMTDTLNIDVLQYSFEIIVKIKKKLTISNYNFFWTFKMSMHYEIVKASVSLCYLSGWQGNIHILLQFVVSTQWGSSSVCGIFFHSFKNLHINHQFLRALVPIQFANSSHRCLLGLSRPLKNTYLVNLNTI